MTLLLVSFTSIAENKFHLLVNKEFRVECIGKETSIFSLPKPYTFAHGNQYPQYMAFSVGDRALTSTDNLGATKLVNIKAHKRGGLTSQFYDNSTVYYGTIYQYRLDIYNDGTGELITVAFRDQEKKDLNHVRTARLSSCKSVRR